MQTQETFKRYEKKYLLNSEQIQNLMSVMDKYMTLDQYGKHTICNIYFDTENFELIRASIEKPTYKEKVRLRSYGVPGNEDNVFLELKKKYDKVVYKRRAQMQMWQAKQYLYEGEKPQKMGQIQKELDFVLDKYHLSPAVYLSYERRAFFGKEQKDLRITLDENILCRQEKLDLREGSFGTSILEEGQVLMEIKIPGSMPLWLSHALAENKIYPISFSKYGTYYKKHILPQMSFAGNLEFSHYQEKNKQRQIKHRSVTC